MHELNLPVEFRRSVGAFPCHAHVLFPKVPAD